MSEELERQQAKLLEVTLVRHELQYLVSEDLISDDK